MNYERLVNCVNGAINEGFIVEPPEGVLDGFSGRKLVGLLQRLVATIENKNDSCYLEVGVFQGLTLLSATLASQEVQCFGIDNFAFHDERGENLGIIESRRAKLAVDNSHLINSDYEDALQNLPSFVGKKKIAVYFVDGPHDYRSQLMCLQLALPYLTDDAVIVVDDCNYRHVRQANRDFLQVNPEFRLVFEAYTPCHPINMTPDQESQARAGWWDGVNVIARCDNHSFPRLFPPTERSRALYENEHLIHAAGLAHCGPEAVEFVGAVISVNPKRVAKALYKLAKKLKMGSREDEKTYFATNTYSSRLPAQRLVAQDSRPD